MTNDPITISQALRQESTALRAWSEIARTAAKRRRAKWRDVSNQCWLTLSESQLIKLKVNC